MPARRNPKNWCSVCGKHIKNSGSGLCWDHWHEKVTMEYGQQTRLSELAHTYSRHRYQSAREHAHRVAKWNMGPKVCAICGYDTYVELCHKKAISKFKVEAFLCEVNAMDNLVWLCPNHHKEWEMGLLHASLA